MMISHRFGSLETLARAEYWLTRHGFEIARSDASRHDVTRLTLKLDFSSAAAAQALIDSIERSDPDGWPGLLDRPLVFGTRASVLAGDAPAHAPSSTPIHFEAREPHPATDPLCCKVCEYMLSRWE